MVVLLSCPLVVLVVAGSQGAREPGSQEGAFPALSRIIREPEGAWTPGRPEQGEGSPKTATVRNGPKTPYIYRYIQVF